MGRTTKSTAPRKSTRARKPTADPPSLRKLQAAAQLIQDTHLKSSRTSTLYKGYVERGQMWLKGLDLTAEDTNPLGLPEDISHVQLPGDFDKTLWATALDSPPNKHSPEALIFYLTHKCDSEACGKSTADGIHAAFKHLWDKGCVD